MLCRFGLALWIWNMEYAGRILYSSRNLCSTGPVVTLGLQVVGHSSLLYFVL